MSKKQTVCWSFILVVTTCTGTDVGNPFSPEGVDFLRSDKQYLSSVEVSGESQEMLQRGNRAFALEMYRQVADSIPREQNLVFSPYSVSSIMAMTYAGADGQTASQMASTMHFELDPQALHLAMNHLSQHFARLSADSDLELNMLNAIWLQKGFPVESNYLDLLSEQYDTGVFLVDYQTEAESVLYRINQWISEQTDHYIEEVFSPGSVDGDTVLALTNSIYLSATWQDRFDREMTREERFTLANGDQVEVEMMSKPFSFSCIINPDWRVAVLPYLDTNIAMVFILPNQDEFEQFEVELDDERLEQITASTSKCDFLYLPKFSFESSIVLEETLKNLGMSDAFNLSTANFSRMSSSSTPLFVDTAIHKANIAIDENGIVASAATGEISTPSAQTRYFIKFDRPFLFMILDQDTNTILFMGRFVRPSGPVVGHISIPTSDAEAICQIVDECGFGSIPRDALTIEPLSKDECLESFADDAESVVDQCADCFRMEYELAFGSVSWQDELCMGSACADYCPTHPFGTGIDLFQ